MSPEIILVNYYFLLLIFNLVPLRYVSTKIITANVNSRYHNVEQLSNKHETECPRGWTRYERTKSCFHVIERRMRWSEAERACANFGGHLASITDEYENMFAFTSGTDLCLTMWLDFDRPEGSWNEWDCNYVSGYSALCKRSLKRTPITTTATSNTRSGSHSGLSYYSRRCCLISSLCHNTSQSCTPEERCIPDDLDCWAKICPNGGIGWCLPLPKI
uniref:BMA-CLEC-178, isoform a n=1 Tax=Brugia malayi TaxID=6279 RepID=A0A0J9Y714_BRUMA|nr:BMA-CLEC-178, isoform a [Brugia malayi]